MILVSVDSVETGKNIRAMMDARGMMPKDIAEACGFIKRQAVYAWLMGRNMPTIDNLVILSDLFGVPIDEIIVRRGK